MVAATSISKGMEIGLSSHLQNVTEVVVDGGKKKRTKEPGIRVVGNRIYDSENGKTCHQCRQKTRDFVASCKILKNRKPCTIKFCHKCLLNRYGEKAEEVELLSDWKCPKCRGHCNCSCCMKSRGQKPTGQMVRTAKASGFKSVLDLLQVKPAENLELDKEQVIGGVDNSSCEKVLKRNAVSPLEPITSEKDLVVDLSGELEKENSLKAQKTSPEKSKKKKRQGLKEISNGNNIDDARRKKSLKRPKIGNEVSEEETKRNANDSIKASNEVLEKEISNGNNIDDARRKKSLKKPKIVNEVSEEVTKRNANDSIKASNEVSKKEMKVDINHEEIDGAEALMHLRTKPSNASLFNPNQHDVKEKVRKYNMNSEKEKVEEEVHLPPGTELTDILGIEFPPEDVGSALQFLEFCKVFGKAVDVKKGEAGAILRELVRKQSVRRGQSTLVVQFHIRLLTLILTDSENGSPSLTTTSGKNHWLKALEDLISGSDLVLKEFPLDYLKKGTSGYYELNLSEKLSLLNFICDEALGTEELRSYIEEENVRYAEEVKEAKCKIAAAKEKEKGLKQKMQDEVAKAIIANGTPLTIAQHDDLLSKIKSEAAQAHAEVLEAKGTIPKRKSCTDAVRIEPVFLDGNGQAFWKLKGYKGEYAVLVQDIKIDDATAPKADEKWFVYGPEKKDEIDKYVSSRAKKPKIKKISVISN